MIRFPYGRVQAGESVTSQMEELSYLDGTFLKEQMNIFGLFGRGDDE